MKIAVRIAQAGNQILNIIVMGIILFLFLYGGYSLWDTYMSAKSAFLSDDLLSYKPQPGEGANPSLEDLMAINKDVAGWITIDDTHIDYPVVQGKDDMEYINKDVYGEFSLSGSIFLSCMNKKDFSDNYNLVYGHHMANGGMFGDVVSFTEKSYFDKHKTGELYLPDKTMHIDLFACMKTSASDSKVYNPQNISKTSESFKSFLDSAYVPAPIEKKQVFGITFEQGRNELNIDDKFFDNIVTENKELTEEAKRDLAISMITLKYTQSNSVCYVKDGQAIGIGAGQQSRIHCTRLAGQKADNWWLRQSPQVMGLQFKDEIRRADRDNAIDIYMGDEYMDVLADGVWENTFKVKPEVFTREEKRAWLDKLTDVALGSDAFFPFGDNIERAHKSGVKYIAQPGGSIRDDNVIDTCNKYGIEMSFTGIRLFHH